MDPLDLVVPSTEAEALAVLGSAAPGEVAILAGGTDLLFDLESGRSRARQLLSLRRLPWSTHAWDEDALRIGSTEPLRTLEFDPLVAERFPALAQAIAAVGSPALRRQATLGGNLGRAAPASDLVPVLLALDAEVELVGPNGPRTIAIDRFVRASRQTELARGELIRSVRLPEPRPSAYLWQRVRWANDISQIGVAVAFARGDGRWRVALGGVPPRAVGVPEVADRLRGPAPPDADVRAAGELLAAHPALVTDRRATDEYRRSLAAVLLRRAVRSAVGGPGGAP